MFGPRTISWDSFSCMVSQLEPSPLEKSWERCFLNAFTKGKGQGHTLLGEPQKALDIYRESERIQPFRPIRDLGVLTILKAQAHAYNGNIDKGVNLALRGLTLANEYHSRRHISRIQRMYDRLRVTPLGRHARLRDLEEVLRLQTK